MARMSVKMRLSTRRFGRSKLGVSSFDRSKKCVSSFDRSKQGSGSFDRSIPPVEAWPPLPSCMRSGPACPMAPCGCCAFSIVVWLLHLALLVCQELKSWVSPAGMRLGVCGWWIGVLFVGMFASSCKVLVGRLLPLPPPSCVCWSFEPRFWCKAPWHVHNPCARLIWADGSGLGVWEPLGQAAAARRAQAASTCGFDQSKLAPAGFDPSNLPVEASQAVPALKV